MTILIFYRTIIEIVYMYLNISNKKSLFENYDQTRSGWRYFYLLKKNAIFLILTYSSFLYIQW